MKFPILAISSAGPNTESSSYLSIASSLGTWSTTETERQIPLEECTITEFSPRITTAPGVGKSWTFVIRKNLEDTAASVKIEGESTTATPWTGSISFAAGDIITIKATPSGTPSAASFVNLYTYFNTVGETFFILGQVSQTTNTGSTTYTQPFGGSGSTWETTESVVRAIIPTNCTLTKLRVKLDGGPGTSKKYEISGRIGGTTDCFTTTLEGSTTVASTSGTQAAQAGEGLTIKVVPTGTPTGRRPGWCLSVTPSTPGETFYGFGFSNIDSTSNLFNIPYGPGGTWSTEANRIVFPPTLLIRKFYVVIGTAPGSGKTRTYTLKNNGVATAASVKLENESISGSYTGSNVNITGGQSFTLASIPTGTPAANTGGVHTGFVILEAKSPTVETKTVAGVTASGATLKGAINPNGQTTTYKFQYGISEVLGSETEVESAGSESSSIEKEKTVSGLISNTKYFYRVVATNATGTTNGSILNFTTTAVPPTVTTEATTEVGTGGATLNGKVNPNSKTTTYWFEYGTTESLGIKIGEGSAGSGSSAVAKSTTLTGLISNTKYFYRIKAESVDGTSTGSILNFTTTAVPPTTITESATGVEKTTATLKGKVNPNSKATTYWFEYGTTEGLGIKAGEASAGSGSSLVEKTQALTSLTANTKYYFRIKAENADGVATGSILNFTTEAEAAGDVLDTSPDIYKGPSDILEKPWDILEGPSDVLEEP